MLTGLRTKFEPAGVKYTLQADRLPVSGQVIHIMHVLLKKCP